MEPPSKEVSSVQGEKKKPLCAFVDYTDDKDYVQPLIESALEKHIPFLNLIHSASDLPPPTTNTITWAAYESLDFPTLLTHPSTQLFNAYVIRKALIRKHYLLNTIENYTKKNPNCLLNSAAPVSVSFEVDYAEFLDEALLEAYELSESMTENETKSVSERQWWILKPGMSDRGVGIRLFSSMEQLQEIFDAFEEDEDDEDEEDDEDAYEDEDMAKSDDGEGDITSGITNSNTTELKIKSFKDTGGIVTSRLRHFVAQMYIPPVLLTPRKKNEAGDVPLPRKFHIRTYVLAVGALKVFVYKEMLALFAAKEYIAPEDSVIDPTSADLSAHLTNTCLQTGDHDGSVVPFWRLTEEFEVDKEKVEGWFGQVCEITGELFKAAVGSGRIHFQPLPNAFEIFGLDFLVGEDGGVRVLEVNAFPDFRQTGEEEKSLVGGLFEEVVRVGIKPFFGEKDGEEKSGEGRMVRVLDMEVGRF
ncbi:hypothetical protein H072_1683 [Dactylellina haptotyla CBS 200.50]|uniref:ATP-grasp domain-containing protein n=1 Tax=Dactylellina haptotyla (strain CBS 200.50) TaxID=1284197 RepID=S8AN42_DACHA|nr:hypothetical protein H072_1683 [Dactylellina haptotyla CBS 200.50]